MSTKELKKRIEDIKPQALKSGFIPVQFEKESSFALQIWNDPKNSYLRQSTMQSFLTSIMNVAKIGLTLNPVAKEAYLIPRYDHHSNSVVCSLEPSYIGIVKLLTDAGSVKSIQTNIVYEGDDIDFDMASANPIVKHIPYVVTGNEKGGIKFVYSKAILHDGTIQVEYMSYAEIMEIRGFSESYKAYEAKKAKSSIWVTWEAEMCRKTVIKRFAKYLPRTEKNEHLNNAIDLLNDDYKISDDQANSIERLMRSSILNDDQKQQIELELNTYTWMKANKIIEYLKNNQRDRVSSGDNYNNKDINARLDYQDAKD